MGVWGREGKLKSGFTESWGETEINVIYLNGDPGALSTGSHRLLANYIT